MALQSAGGRRGAEGRAGRAPANTTAKGGTANDGGPEGATPPPPPPREKVKRQKSVTERKQKTRVHP